ncbi:MAG: HipA domain-containing protein [Clostridia bacterium]|nr:HipA domain-containing protein [Clostridia bacterium]
MSLEIINFDKCKSYGKLYGGSEEKLALIHDGKKYMVKFQKDSPYGLRFNHISEYVGSHIYNMLGINAQETILGTYKDRYVVGCLDFLEDDEKFVPFNDVGESTIDDDMENYQYSYEDILELLNANKKLTNTQDTVSAFFDMFIVDSLIGNFDRHGMN